MKKVLSKPISFLSTNPVTVYQPFGKLPSLIAVENLYFEIISKGSDKKGIFKY